MLDAYTILQAVEAAVSAGYRHTGLPLVEVLRYVLFCSPCTNKLIGGVLWALHGLESFAVIYRYLIYFYLSVWRTAAAHEATNSSSSSSCT